VGMLAVAMLCAIKWFETTAEMPRGEAAIWVVKAHYPWRSSGCFLDTNKTPNADATRP
jgi:hypothetical protein